MKYKIDHDYHIHSQLSSCSRHPEQTPERILQYAKDNGLKEICITDHYWDSEVEGASNWYSVQNFEHISQADPLPFADGISFLFGCETDMKKDCEIGIPAFRFDDFGFVIIPTTHLHMKRFTIEENDMGNVQREAALWVERFDALLSKKLPFGKIGVAHLACSLIDKTSRENYLSVLNSIPDDELERLFAKAAALGCGIELNQGDMSFADSEADTVLRIFRTARGCGCKFYLGSDAHTPDGFKKTRQIFERAIDLLDLSENDKFHIAL